MRVREADERPRALEALKGMLNYTRHFLVSLKNFTGEDQPFTMVEFDVLSKLINDTKVSRTLSDFVIGVVCVTSWQRYAVKEIVRL